MTDEDILKKAISQAVKNGWKPQIMGEYNEYVNQIAIDTGLQFKEYYALIFSHDFAKAFWGEEETEIEIHGNYGLDSDSEESEKLNEFISPGDYASSSALWTGPKWKLHLQIMVLLSDNERIQYLKKFI